MPPTQRTNLREAHAHIPWHARSLAMLNLERCRSISDCLILIAAEARRTPRGAWLLAPGARIESWSTPHWPTLQQLDAVTGAIPCCIMSFDHHAAIANTTALTAAGVLDIVPAGGVVERDDLGNPTGLLLESAAYQVWNSAPEPTQEQWGGLVAAALEDLSRHGFTQLHELFAPAWLGPMLADMDREGRLSLEIHLFAPFADLDAEVQRARSYTTDRVHLAGAKLFADGTLNSRTAHMLHAFADPIPDSPTGKVITDTGTITAALNKVASLGLQLAVHAIGDGAVRSVLDAAAAARPIRTHSALPILRIEHCELIDERDIPRFADLNVIASVQPCHLLADIEVLHRQLRHRLHRVLPLRELINAGLVPGRTLIFGSDTPIVRPDPADSIQAAVERRRLGTPASDAIAPAQAITTDEAWSAFTPR